MLGLPDGVHGCLFDLDGVLTKTAQVHDAAWQQMSGEFGCVVGADRPGQADALAEHGADVVVTDLAELLDRL